MTVLVTGASGFLGSHIVEQLAQSGRPVRALVRKTSNTKFLESLENVELAYGSVDDQESVLAAADGVEAIIHAAGLVKARGPAEFWSINTEGTQRRNTESIHWPKEHPKGWFPLTGGPAEPHQVAKTISFLLSDDADYISGSEIWVDSGSSLL